MNAAIFVFACLFVGVIHMDAAYGNERENLCGEIRHIGNQCQGSDGSGFCRIVGSPGKRGEPGIPGEGFPGPEGPPGRVDYEMLNAMIDGKIQSVEKKLTAKIELLNQKLQDLLAKYTVSTRSPSDAVTPPPDLCKVMYEGKCFWVVTHDTYDITLKLGTGFCAANKGKLANIYSKSHYKTILNYLRKSMPSSLTYYDVWTGMTTNPLTEDVFLDDGKIAPHVDWLLSYPWTASTYTRIRIGVRKDPTSSSQGMYNFPPSSPSYGVLCQS